MTNRKRAACSTACRPSVSVTRRRARAGKTLLLAVALLVVLAGCGPAWQATVVAPDGRPFLVDDDVLENLARFAAEDAPQTEGKLAVPLEQVLYTAGHHAVAHLVALSPDGTRRQFDWAAVADDACWQRDGRIAVGGDLFSVSRLEVEPPLLLDRVAASIIDVAPTVAAALDLPAPTQATGRALEAPKAAHVLLLLLDGFGYLRYTEALHDGLIPHLAVLGEPLPGLTVYPPATNVASAALLTGAPPQVNGVDQRGIRMTKAETLLDVAAIAGRRVVAVEGDALAFNLRNADLQLSGDRDGNGTTDDNVLANALAVLEAGMPDLLFVHFHGIDDAGHTYGPGAPQEAAAIRQVDTAVGHLLELLPDSTLIIMLADHGMHRVEEEGRLGNHGRLIDGDMFIPILLALK